METIIALQQTFSTILALFLSCAWLAGQFDITELDLSDWFKWIYVLTLVFSIFAVFITTIARIWV
jgi:hypothetical protein